MLKSESIQNITAALFSAQPSMRAAVKDSKNPHLNSRYADLGSVYEACKEPLYAVGILILQDTDSPVRWFGEQQEMALGVMVRTTLLHVKSGEWIAAQLTVRPIKEDAQTLGSTITYLRRYTLQTVTGTLAEDDDGHAASHRPPPAPPALPAQRETVKAPKALTLKERKEIAMTRLIDQFGAARAKAFVDEIIAAESDNALRVAAMESMVTDENMRKGKTDA